jgi:hypothetical protein
MGTGTDVTMESAPVTLVRGDLRGIARARGLSRATMRNIQQNLFCAFVYNAAGVPVAAGVLYPFFGLLLSPMIAAAAMSFRSVSSARFMLLGSEHHGAVCDVCADVCEACAKDCERLDDDELMRQCAEVCRRCAQSWREVARTKVS